MTTPSPYWFPAKRYGWGWGPPTSWHGWVVTIIWFIVLLVGGLIIAPRSPIAFAAFTVAMVLAIVGVCLVKGEPPRWRWGDDD